MVDLPESTCPMTDSNQDSSEQLSNKALVINRRTDDVNMRFLLTHCLNEKENVRTLKGQQGTTIKNEMTDDEAIMRPIFYLLVNFCRKSKETSESDWDRNISMNGKKFQEKKRRRRKATWQV